MKKPKKIDALIVGGGLIGLKLLKKLESENKSVLLIEKSADLGGSTFTFNNDSSECELQSILWTTDESKNTETFTLGKKGLSPFLSFGSYKGDALEVAESFTQVHSAPIKNLELGKDLGLDLNSNKNIKTLTQATQLLTSTEGSHLCEVNGKDLLEYSELHWTASLDQMLKLKAKDDLVEIRQKLGKCKRFDALTIQFNAKSEQFKDHTDSKFILFGESDTPWMGALLNDDVLTFTSFFLSSKSQDHDFIRRHLKSLKRQVRKFFPDLYTEDQISIFSTDRLTVHSEVLSQMSISAKTMKALKPLVFYGSHKSHYPSPFESKEKMVLEANESASEVQRSLNTDLAM